MSISNLRVRIKRDPPPLASHSGVNWGGSRILVRGARRILTAAGPLSLQKLLKIVFSFIAITCMILTKILGARGRPDPQRPPRSAGGKTMQQLGCSPCWAPYKPVIVWWHHVRQTDTIANRKPGCPYRKTVFLSLAPFCGHVVLGEGKLPSLSPDVAT